MQLGMLYFIFRALYDASLVLAALVLWVKRRSLIVLQKTYKVISIIKICTAQSARSVHVDIWTKFEAKFLCHFFQQWSSREWWLITKYSLSAVTCVTARPMILCRRPPISWHRRPICIPIVDHTYVNFLQAPFKAFVSSLPARGEKVLCMQKGIYCLRELLLRKANFWAVRS